MTQETGSQNEATPAATGAAQVRVEYSGELRPGVRRTVIFQGTAEEVLTAEKTYFNPGAARPQTLDFDPEREALLFRSKSEACQ